MENNELTGSLPSQIGSLPKLRWLSVHNNKLTGEIPSSIDKLTKIETLYLYNNKFEGTAPFGVCEVKSLKDYFTSCTGTFPQVVCHCCTACCSNSGCYKEEAEILKQDWLKRKSMSDILIDL